MEKRTFEELYGGDFSTLWRRILALPFALIGAFFLDIAELINGESYGL